MKKNTIAESVTLLAEPIAKELGLLIWDVFYGKEGADMILRITIDKEDGVDINDCEAMHRAIDPKLDEADLIEASYHLEVSSPGIEREITEPWQVEFCKGWNVEVRLFAAFEGKKVYRGILQGYDENNNIALAIDENTTISFEKASIASLRTYYEFED